jgi:segregation and condensation protein B
VNPSPAGPPAGAATDGQSDDRTGDALTDAARATDAPAEIPLRGALEALLFVADGPLSVQQLASAVQQPVEAVTEALAGIAADLDARQSGWQLRPAAAGVRLYTRDRYAAVVEAFLLEGRRGRLSQAALETLAVIAYRQPVTRARIAAIRGVNVDGVVRTLLARELIAETAADPYTGGARYRTTEVFLEKMGIASVTELPSLAPFLPELDTLEADGF